MPPKKRIAAIYLCSWCILFCIWLLDFNASPLSSISKSMHSLLSVVFMLVPSAGLTNKLDLLSEKSQRLVNTSLNPLQETKRVSTEGIYEHRSALMATSGLHNRSLLMCWNCFWRQTDWYNGVVWVLKGWAASAEAWFTDLGSIYPFASALFGVCAEATELADKQGPLRGAGVLLWTSHKQEMDPYYAHSWFLLQTG